jgi:hypothetical protein
MLEAIQKYISYYKYTQEEEIWKENIK